MENEPISQKLSELYDLYKSGALTIEEYNLLKSKLISIEETPVSEVVETSRMESAIPGTSGEKRIPVNAKNNAKKRPWIILGFSVGLLVVIIAGILFMNRKPVEWNEASAKKIILEELANYPDWSEKGGEPNTWQHEVNIFHAVSLNTKEIMVAICASSSDDYASYWSIFEFENQRGWKLRKKSIAFMEDFGFEPIVNNISPDNYCIIFSLEDNAMGGLFGVQQNVYAFLNEELQLIFTLENSWRNNYGEHYTYDDLKLKFVQKNDGYYDIETHEMNSSGYNPKLGAVIYKFNGTEYVSE